MCVVPGADPLRALLWLPLRLHDACSRPAVRLVSRWPHRPRLVSAAPQSLPDISGTAPLRYEWRRCVVGGLPGGCGERRVRFGGDDSTFG